VKEISLASLLHSYRVGKTTDSSLPKNQIKKKNAKSYQRIDKSAGNVRKIKRDTRTLAVLTRQSENGVSLHSFTPH